MKNYINSGDQLTLVAPSGGVTSGETLQIGSVAVVVHESASEGAEFVGYTCGVFNVPTAASPTAGATAYMTTATGAITTVATNGIKIGAFVTAKVGGNADVWFTGQVV
jgi:predicted RecA/RadA family phage recombinase